MAWWKRNNPAALSDEVLMQRAAGGEDAAFSELYDRYADRLFRFACKMLSFDREKARDLVQDCFLKIIEQPALFNPAYSFQTWIFTMLANRCKNEIRNNLQRQQLLEQLGWSISTTAAPDLHQLDHASFLRAADEVFRNLPEELQLVFTLRFQQELKLKEIALILQIPEGTVKSRLYYLTQHLAKELAIYAPNL